MTSFFVENGIPPDLNDTISSVNTLEAYNLGAKAVDPTVDNEGNALVEGAQYYNTTSDVIKTWNGAAWVAATGGGGGAASWGTITGTLSAQSDLNAALADKVATADIGSTVQAYDADTLKSDTSTNMTAGYSCTQYNIGTINSGNVILDFANGNEQKYTNNGGHQLTPPTMTAGRACSITVEVTNGASAGAINTSAFTKVIDGSALVTNNGYKFKLGVHVGDAGSLLTVVAMQ